MPKIKAVILATEGMTTNMLYHSISSELDVIHVFIEESPSKKHLFKRRIKRIGWLKSLGQLAFLLLVRPFIPAKKKRIQEILDTYMIKNQTIPNELVTKVPNINEVLGIQDLNPDLVIINGTRILQKDFLNSINCPIVNIHVGITPKYRGVHGGFWAIRNNEPELFGVTLHQVDAGIDTGKIIAQHICTPTKEDNFKTYPILQYAEGIRLLQQYVESIVERKLPTQKTAHQ